MKRHYRLIVTRGAEAHLIQVNVRDPQQHPFTKCPLGVISAISGPFRFLPLYPRKRPLAGRTALAVTCSNNGSRWNSITLFGTHQKDSGIVRPSAFAVVRLTARIGGVPLSFRRIAGSRASAAKN
jgi:hypothetical protein